MVILTVFYLKILIDRFLNIKNVTNSSVKYSFWSILKMRRSIKVAGGCCIVVFLLKITTKENKK